MLLDRFRLDGRAAIVTGASRGIGAACAVALAEAGADLVICARTEEALGDVAAAVAGHGRKAETIACDVADLSGLGALVERAMSAFGRIDVVMNNVGGAMPAPFANTRVRHLEEAFHFNVSTAFELTRLAVPHMLDGDGGSVINVTSAVGRFRERGYAVYSTAKAALAHLTRNLAIDLAPRIRVNAIAPGAVLTDALGLVLDDTMRETMIGLTPMRRLGDVDDIALAAVYLASSASSYVTGKVLEVDGGIEAANLPLGIPDL